MRQLLAEAPPMVPASGRGGDAEGLFCTTDGCTMANFDPESAAGHSDGVSLQSLTGKQYQHTDGPMSQADTNDARVTDPATSASGGNGEEEELVASTSYSSPNSLSEKTIRHPGDKFWPLGSHARDPLGMHLTNGHPSAGHEIEPQDSGPGNGALPTGHLRAPQAAQTSTQYWPVGHDRGAVLELQRDAWDADADAVDVPGLLIVTPNGPLCFANVQRVYDHICVLEVAAMRRWGRKQNSPTLGANRQPGEDEELARLTGACHPLIIF